MLRLLFVAAILSVGTAAALRSRFAALLLYVWFALFRPQEWVWVDISAYHLSTVLGILLVVPCIVGGRLPVLTHPLMLGALGFFLTSLTAQMNALDPALGWVWIDYVGKLILVSMLAVRLSDSRSRLLNLIAVIVASFGFQAAKAGFSSLLQGGSRYFDGTAGAFVDNNAYAVGCVMVLPLAIIVAQNAPQRWLRRLAFAAVPMIAVTVVSTYSRGGLLALSAAILAYILLHKRRVPLVMAALVLVPLLWFVPLPAGYSERMATITTYDQVEDSSALGRLHFWRVALHMAADRPMGIGLWNFQTAYDLYDTSGGLYGNNRAVHSSHLQVLTENGWLGALFWVFLFATALRICFRMRKRAIVDPDQRWLLTTANGLIASMVGFLVGGSFVSMALNDLTWLTFALVASADRVSRAVPEQVVTAHRYYSPASAKPAFAQS